MQAQVRPVVTSSFKPAWWLKHAHLQTIFAKYLSPRKKQRTVAELFALPDGDELELNWMQPSKEAANAPMVVILHGLAGNIHSHYIQGILAQCRALHWPAVLMHFRGCNGVANRLPRAYHSGDTADLAYLIAQIQLRYPGRELAAVGFSLGGNVLLKWLGEQEGDARQVVSSAVSVSAPVDLLAGANSLAKGFNRVYTRMFLGSLIPKSIEKIKRFPELGNVDAVASCKDFFDFDNRVTAPWHGFRDAEHYYAVSSAKPLLKNIAVPTLMIHAKNDPFMNGQHLPTAGEVSGQVSCLFTEHGGHVGFANGRSLRLGLDWLPKQCDAFFAQHSAKQTGASGG